MPKEERKEAALELKKAHFRLGSDQNHLLSCSQEHYRGHTVTSSPSRNNEELSSKIKRANFKIGTNTKFYRETTNTKDFNEKEMLSSPRGKEIRKDDGVAHFALGFRPNRYDTTTGETFDKINQKDSGTPTRAPPLPRSILAAQRQPVQKVKPFDAVRSLGNTVYETTNSVAYQA